jgi:hypothetical protein
MPSIKPALRHLAWCAPLAGGVAKVKAELAALERPGSGAPKS